LTLTNEERNDRGSMLMLSKQSSCDKLRPVEVQNAGEAAARRFVLQAVRRLSRQEAKGPRKTLATFATLRENIFRENLRYENPLHRRNRHHQFGVLTVGD
jgi:hypothetical protein